MLGCVEPLSEQFKAAGRNRSVVWALIVASAVPPIVFIFSGLAWGEDLPSAVAGGLVASPFVALAAIVFVGTPMFFVPRWRQPHAMVAALWGIGVGLTSELALYGVNWKQLRKPTLTIPLIIAGGLAGLIYAKLTSKTPHD